MTIDVRPEEIHTCAGQVTDAGNEWGIAHTELRTGVDEIGDLYGQDTIGQAIHQVFDPFLPKATTYTGEVGFAVIETATVLDRVAVSYMDVESDNVELARKVAAEVDRLGR